MHVNLMRPCVGIGSPRELYDNQLLCRQLDGTDHNRYNYFTTRNTPKRKNEILNGGSVYWIVKGAIIMRQTIVDIETLVDDHGKKFCMITKDPEIMLVQPKQQRAMQGWRYLEADQSPPDLYPFDPHADDNANNLDEQMARELGELGLL